MNIRRGLFPNQTVSGWPLRANGTVNADVLRCERTGVLCRDQQTSCDCTVCVKWRELQVTP